MAEHAERTVHDLRCACSRRVKLAQWGRDTDGRAYLHIKVFKSHRMYSNTLHKGGEHELLCHCCLRVTRVFLAPKAPRICAPSRRVPPELRENS